MIHIIDLVMRLGRPRTAWLLGAAAAAPAALRQDYLSDLSDVFNLVATSYRCLSYVALIYRDLSLSDVWRTTSVIWLH